jgi:long-chain acyl-CoA synthetase
MRGYWRDPERTAEVLRDGWYATGDLGRQDRDGNIWLLGRAKEMIVLPSGMKVWPTDVEDVLRQQPAVKDAAVVTAPTAGGGLTLHAYLIPRTSEAATGEPRAVIAAANADLAVHQRVATASWWPDEDFPRTTTLKVRRHLLPTPDAATQAATGALAAVPVSVAAGRDPVVQAIQGVARVDRVDDAATLGELGFDSLTLIELALALQERTGVAVSDDDLHAGLTVAELRALVGHAPAVNTDTARAQREQYDEGSDPPRWAYGPIGRFFRGLSLPFVLLYRAGVTDTIVLGAEHLRDLPRQVVLAGTHHSWPDFMLVREALRRGPARRLDRHLIVPAAAVVMHRAGPLGLYTILSFGLFPIRQYSDQERSLRMLARLAGAGNPVLIFPQGHHADPAAERAGDPAASFKTGAALIAQAMGAIVVPFGLAGTERLIPPTDEGFKGLAIAGIPVTIRRGPAAIAFGEPLRLEPDETPHAFTRRLQEVAFALTRQAETALAERQSAGQQAQPVP